MELIGERIKRLRLQRGLTQEELADRCELSKGFISLVERCQQCEKYLFLVWNHVDDVKRGCSLSFWYKTVTGK